MHEHRSLSEDAKQVQSCPIFDVNVPNQGFATLNISRNQPSDTVYWNSSTTPRFQPQAMPGNFTQAFADNHYPRDQQHSRHLFGSQMNHSFQETHSSFLSNCSHNDPAILNHQVGSVYQRLFLTSSQATLWCGIIGTVFSIQPFTTFQFFQLFRKWHNCKIL